MSEAPLARGAASSLRALAAAAGVEREWTDARGRPAVVGDESLEALLGAMGFDLAGDAEARAAAELERLEAERALAPPALLLARAGQRPTLDASRSGLAEGDCVEVALADGATLEGRLEGDRDAARPGSLALPFALPIGRHALRATGKDGETELPLAACPERCPSPGELGVARAWGLAVQVPGLRSNRNGGVGDLADVAAAAEAAAGQGADLLGLSPLHALFPADPRAVSPYAPSSRRFSHWLPIAVDAAAKRLGAAVPGGWDGAAGFEGDLVDFPAAARRKRDALDALWAGFWPRAREPRSDDAAARAFDAFREAGGEALERHALFDALHEDALGRAGHEDAKDGGSWAFWGWAEDRRSPEGAGAKAFAADRPERLGFFAFLQWLADEQLAEAQARALAAGMRVGLYQDVAVGANPAGSAAWADPGVAVRGVSIGAPPDLFSPKGQSWGLAPYDPRALEARGFEPLLADLRAALRHAGAVRVDHAIGLARQWWVPDGLDASKGAYVRFPFERIAGLIALEASGHGHGDSAAPPGHAGSRSRSLDPARQAEPARSGRRRRLIIGEDLGTVPPGFDRRMREAGMLSCKVFWFERGTRPAEGGTRPAESGAGPAAREPADAQAFQRPRAWKPLALASLSTHDLPTLRGWWKATDVAERERLDLFADPEAPAAERAERAADRRRLLRALRDAGLAPLKDEPDPNSPEPPPWLAGAVHRLLGRSRSALALAQLEDALGQEGQANLPGTVEGHPNWRRRYTVAVDGLADDPGFRAVCAALRAERPRGDA